MTKNSCIISVYPDESDNLMGIGYEGIYPTYKPVVYMYDEGVLYAAPAENGATVNTASDLFTLVNGTWEPVVTNERPDYEWQKVEEA